MDQPRRQFLAETEDLIDQIFVELDDLRENKNDAEQQGRLVDSIFRRLHRIKGSAATFGLEGLGEVAHEFESLLSAVRSGSVVAGENVLDTCESATGALSESLNLAASGIVDPSRRALFERIHALVPMPSKNVAPAASVDVIRQQLPAPIWQSLTDDEKQRTKRSAGRGLKLCIVDTSFDIASFDEHFNSLKERLSRHGEVIASSPAADTDHPDKINFRILFAGNSDVDSLPAELADFPGVSLIPIEVGTTFASQAEHPEQIAKVPTELTFPASSNFIRTDLEDLDRLISSTHELFRTTAHALDLAVSTTGSQAKVELTRLSNEIRRSFLGVEDELIGLRMISLGPVLQRAARAGRAAARQSEKEVDFKVVGKNLRLDKLLCDAIADPLVHLVRNAVDHGIEDTAGRAAAGKLQRGHVLIEAVMDGSQTRVRVRDDGSGVDTVRVSEAAKKMGILEPDRPIDMDLSLRLIFRPGFSTVAQASAISGRGVGLDVVETAVEQVGGEVRVSSEPGSGTIFEIRLPVTFGLVRSAVVLAGEYRYCIDADQVLSTFKADDKILSNTGVDTPDSTAGPLQLIRLSEMMGQAALDGVPQAPIEVIICKPPEERGDKGLSFASDRAMKKLFNGRKRLGIVVDELIGTEEVLIRNLGHHAGRWYGIAGATELHDGTVALVLDLPRLLSQTDFETDGG